MSGISFAAKHAPLVDDVRKARQEGNRLASRRALEELLAAYRKLGERRTGTSAEQNAYIVARCLGTLPDVLVELGVEASDLPMPAARRPAPSPSAPTAPTSDGEIRIAERFARIRCSDNEEPAARFTVVPRPQDNMRYRGRAQPFAVVDKQDGRPVAWYEDREWAEMIADQASRMREAG